MRTDHHLTTLDLAGRVIHPYEALIIDMCLRNDLLVRMCSCGYICAGETMTDVTAHYSQHEALVA